MSDEQDEFVNEIREKAERIESQLKRQADWVVLRDLAERIFVAAASNPGSPPYDTCASASFLAAEHFIREANKRAPK